MASRRRDGNDQPRTLDPMSLLFDEPAAVRRSGGLVDVTGPDRLGYLHTLLTQDLEEAQPGTAADFLYLDPKGNALASGRALVAGDRVLLVTPVSEIGAELAAALERNKFLTRVEAVDVTAGAAFASVRGPDPVACADAPTEPMTVYFDGDGAVVRDRSGGIDLVGPEPWVGERLEALGLPVAGDSDWEAWRLSHGEPAWGSEIAPGRRPQELGLLPTHLHLRKGCYPGQESVAKTFNRGHPRRALAVVEADAPLAPRDQVDAGERRRQVTSAAQVGDSWVGLALVPAGDDGRLPEELSAGGEPVRIRRRVGEGLPIPGATPP
jgi:tRNA-modifying protein YgfZ